MYAIEDFGCEIDYSDVSKGGVARVVKTPIKEAKDWYQLNVSPITEGSLARELKSLELILDKVKDEDVPVIFTVFSPLTTANKLSGNTLIKHLEEGHEDAVQYALEIITETTCNLAKEAIRMGADGIFFAVQNSAYGFMSAEDYRKFGVPYDLRVLDAAKDGWMNTLHAHGNNIMMEILKDYPVQVFNWHAWETLPTVDEASVITGKCLMGGLSRTDITECNRNEIFHQIYECLRLMRGRGHILTPGCVIRHPLNDSMLKFIRTTKDEVEAKLNR